MPGACPGYRQHPCAVSHRGKKHIQLRRNAGFHMNTQQAQAHLMLSSSMTYIPLLHLPPILTPSASACTACLPRKLTCRSITTQRMYDLALSPDGLASGCGCGWRRAWDHAPGNENVIPNGRSRSYRTENAVGMCGGSLVCSATSGTPIANCKLGLLLQEKMRLDM